MANINLNDNEIIKEFLKLPGLQDSQSSVKSQLKIAEYYCSVFEYRLYSLKNKIFIDSKGRDCTVFGEFDYIFIEFLLCDPMSFINYFESQYKWPYRNRIKCEEVKKSFNKNLYEKIENILNSKHILPV